MFSSENVKYLNLEVNCSDFMSCTVVLDFGIQCGFTILKDLED